MADSIKLNIPNSAAERASRSVLTNILRWFKDGELNAEQAVSAIGDWRNSTAPAGEVVAWQRRLKKHHADEWSDWHPCSKEQAEYALLNGGPRDYENHLWAEVRPLYATPPAITAREKPTPNERFTPRMLILDDLHAVCVGGRWDGWKFYRHPDGQWVSLEKLKESAFDGGDR